MLKKSLFISLVFLVLVSGFVFGQKVYRVNNLGQITVDGTPTRIKGGSWFGLEGRHEPSTDANNPSGAPMEQYMGNVWWQPSSRTYDQDINEFKAQGINLVRLPLVPQTLDANDPQGKAPFLKNNPDVRIENARKALETIVTKLNAAGIYVLLDLHSCSNYVGWRKGRLDARPPWADRNREDYDYKRENCSCSSTGNPAGVDKIAEYNETKWLANLKTIAGFASTLNVSNILGIDIYNEPWDYSWADWKSLIEKAYNAINSVNTNVLIFAQGISGSNGNQDGTPDDKQDTPHGDKGNPNWGENLYEAGNNPPNIPKERLVYSPHCYGPSVCTQPMFADPSQPECATLQEDAFGDAKCNIIINKDKLRPSWEEHFGYLKDLGYAICIGEFGGNRNWPGKADKRMRARYSYITDQTLDWQWQTVFKDWLIERGITDTIYWSINPESADTGGLYTTPYDAVSNTGGWGTWNGWDSTKVSMLKEIWNAPTKTPGSTPTPTPTVTSTGKKGDANGDGTININDALLIARYSAALSTPTIVTANCDVNGDGIININDALLIARYSAGFTVPQLSGN